MFQTLDESVCKPARCAYLHCIALGSFLPPLTCQLLRGLSYCVIKSTWIWNLRDLFCYCFSFISFITFIIMIIIIVVIPHKGFEGSKWEERGYLNDRYSLDWEVFSASWACWTGDSPVELGAGWCHHCLEKEQLDVSLEVKITCLWISSDGSVFVSQHQTCDVCCMQTSPRGLGSTRPFESSSLRKSESILLSEMDIQTI